MMLIYRYISDLVQIFLIDSNRKNAHPKRKKVAVIFTPFLPFLLPKAKTTKSVPSVSSNS